MNDVFLVDTHVHLDMIDHGRHTREVLDRASDEGVGALISVGIDLESSVKAVEYARRYPQVSAAVGIHPNDSQDFDAAAVNRLMELAVEQNVVGWGEIGLDYYRKHTPAPLQQQAFEAQLEAAASLDMPVIIHDRDAHEDCLSILKSFCSAADLTGVFHCFSADREVALQALDLGFYISFTGVITFPRTEDLSEVVRFVPLDRLLVETDSPFLSPVPFRGKPNEPARVGIVAERIARIKDIPLEEVAQWTTRNAEALFGLQLR